MALAVGFKIEPTLEDALATFKVSDSQRCLVVVIEGELMKLDHGPTAKTSDFTADLAEVRKHITGAGKAAFIITRVAEKKEVQLVMYVPEDTKPKQKMMIASSALHLRNAANMGISGETRLEDPAGFNPELFGEQTEEERNEMMTENEKNNAEIEKMEKAPAGPPKQMMGALPGVGAAVDGEVRAAVTKLKAGDIRAFVAEIQGGAITSESTIDKEVELKDLAGKLPADKPRYVIVNWTEDRTVLVYVCPPGCKPKERMPYASMKAAFVSQLETLDCKVTKSVEIDTAEELYESVETHLKPAEAEAEDTMKPIAPAKVGGKGPRMLI